MILPVSVQVSPCSMLEHGLTGEEDLGVLVVSGLLTLQPVVGQSRVLSDSILVKCSLPWFGLRCGEFSLIGMLYHL